MKKPLNHNRPLDYYRPVGERAVEVAKATPTSKQVRFCRKLFALCREHNVETDTGMRLKTRVDYAQTIDVLLARLQGAGVDVNGNGKRAGYVFSVDLDRNGNYRGHEHIVLRDSQPSSLARKIEALMSVDLRRAMGGIEE